MGNPVFWRRGARPRSDRSPNRGGWLSVVLATGALAFALLGVAGIRFPLDETVTTEVILLCEPPTRDAAEVARRCAVALAARPSVASVELRLSKLARTAYDEVWAESPGVVYREAATTGSPLSAYAELDAIAASGAGNQPRFVICLHPHGPANPAAWAELAARCRQAGVSCATVSPPEESLPGAWFAVPSRQTPPADPQAAPAARPDLAFGGNFYLMCRNLEMLGPGAFLRLKAHSDPRAAGKAIGRSDPLPEAGFNPSLLAKGVGAWTVAPSSPGMVREVTLRPKDLAKPPEAAEAARRHTNILLWPGNSGGALAGWAQGLEAEVIEGERVVSASYRAVDVNPPRTFYLPLAAALPPSPGRPAWWPTVPQNPDLQGRRQRVQPAWNLSWPRQLGHGADLLAGGKANPQRAAGMTVWWPRDRAAALDLSKSEAECDALYLQLREAGAIYDPRHAAQPLPPLESLKQHKAVILDAAVPGPVSADFGLSRNADGKFVWDRDDVRYVGGFLLAAEKVNGHDLYVTKDQLDNWVDTALVPYLDAGGLLVLAGVTRQAYDEPPKEWGADAPRVFNFRALLERLAAASGSALAALDRSACPPRRFAIAFDDTRGGARTREADSAFHTLPPLTDDAQKPIDFKKVDEVRRQLRQLLGEAAPSEGTNVTIPGLSDLLRRTLGELGLAGETGQANDPEFTSLLAAQLYESTTDFAAGAARWLRGIYLHPEIDLEVQGRAAFRRGVATAKADPKVFQQPFPHEPDGARPLVWRDRYRTVFMGTKQGSGPRGWELGIRPEPGSRPLLSGVRPNPWLLALKGTLYRSKPEEYWKAPQPFPRDLTLSFWGANSGTAVNKDNLVYWPFLTPSGKQDTYPMVLQADSRLPALRGQHFLYLSGGPVGKGKPLLPPAQLLQSHTDPKFDARQRIDWWWATHIVQGDPASLYSRLLPSGRGRFYGLLTLAMAGEVQSVPAELIEKAADKIGQIGGAAPEATDAFSQLVYDRLVVSIPPPYRPKASSPWIPLARCGGAGGEPLVAAARFGSTGAKAKPGGRVVLAMVDTAYEQLLDGLVTAPHAGWVDYSQAMANLVPLDTGFRLEPEPPTDGPSILNYRIVPLRINPATVPPLMTGEPPEKGTWKLTGIQAHPHLGLTNASPLQLGLTESLQLKPPSGSSGVSVSFGPEGLLLGSGTRQNVGLIESALHLSDKPAALPPLLEFQLSHDKPSQTVSVFAPLRRVSPRAIRRAEQAGWHPSPVVHLLESIVELFGQQPEFRCEVLADRAGFRVYPQRSSATAGLSGRTFRFRSSAEALDPIPEPLIDRSLPGQLVVRFPAKKLVTTGQHCLLEVAGPSSRLETHHFFLPGVDPAGKPIAIPLRPGELADPFPAPQDFCLDTLTLGTLPDHLLGRARQPELTWTAAERGALLLPLTLSQGEAMAVFATEALQLRSAYPSSRSWFLAALVLLALGCFSKWKQERTRLRSG